MAPSVCASQASWTGSWCSSVKAASCQLCCPVIYRLLPVRNTARLPFSMCPCPVFEQALCLHPQQGVYLCVDFPGVWDIALHHLRQLQRRQLLSYMSWVVPGSMWGAAGSHLVQPDSPSHSTQDSASPRCRYKCLKWSHEIMLLICCGQQHSAHNLVRSLTVSPGVGGGHRKQW